MTKKRPITPVFGLGSRKYKEEPAMSIHLRTPHKEILVDILQLVVDYKIKALKTASWNRFEQDYLRSAVEQLANNDFKMNHPTKNFFFWLIDQICYSRTIVPGVRHQDGVILADTELGQQSIEICRQAARGQTSYDYWSSGNRFHDLFD